MIKILFVCHGNICRSPMAEFVMKNMVEKAGLSNQFEIDSAGTSTEELGNPVYPPARHKLKEHGISCEGKRARQITGRDFDYYDHIICMDRYNVQNCRRAAGKHGMDKVSLLLSVAGINRDVADPWYTDDFEATWQDVNIGCKALLGKLSGK